MKIAGISGSPNNGGNNEKLIDYSLEYAKGRGFETDKIFLSQKKVLPCIDCGACRKGDCPIEDEMDGILRLLESADGIIVSSPVYFGCVSAQLKALFDRSIPLRRQGKRLKKKVGAAIAVGGARNGGQELTIQAIHSWMFIHGMIVVSDGDHFGGTVLRPHKDDQVGMNTVKDTISMLCDALEMFGNKSV